MKVLGVDPSTTLAGLAIAENDELVDISVWKPSHAKDATHRRLFDFYAHVNHMLIAHRPALVSIAVSHNQRNMKTVRALARAEGAVILPSKRLRIPIVEAGDKTGRSIVLEKGNMKKEDVLPALKKVYPGLPWLPKTRGGEDEADAAVAALAGPTVLERQ